MRNWEGSHHRRSEARQASLGVPGRCNLAAHYTVGKVEREEPFLAPEASCAFADAGQLAEVKSAAQYLNARRSYKGLETPHHSGAEAKEASLAVPGRSGRAAHYVDEPDRSKGRVDALRKIHS